MTQNQIHSALRNYSPNNFFPLEEAACFGTNTERLRTAAALSKAEFCRVANISRPTLYKIERGEANLQLSLMRQIADALEVSVVDMLQPPPPPL